VEAADAVLGRGSEANHLVKFYKSSLENDLKFFHTPSSGRVKAIFVKLLKHRCDGRLDLEPLRSNSRSQ
jgi:hypothetical protein